MKLPRLRSFRVSIFFFIVMCFCIPNHASNGDYDVSITTIEIWVKVLDHSGKPVDGLSANDFQVYEDGQLMNQSCFEEQKTDVPYENAHPQQSPMESQTQTNPRATSIGSETTSSIPDTQQQEIANSGLPNSINSASSMKTTPAKKIVLFLDLYDTSQPEMLFMKPKLQTFLEKLGKKHVSLMLAALLPNGKVGVVAPFSEKIQFAEREVDKAKGNFERDARILERKRELSTLAHATHADTTVEASYSLARFYQREEMHASEVSLQSLEIFSKYLSLNNQGDHIMVLLVSGGINSEPGKSYFETLDKLYEKRGYGQDMSKFRLTHPTASKADNIYFLQEIKKSIRELNRFNLTVYSINTRGNTMPSQALAVGGGGFGNQDVSTLQDYQATLDQVADETGGLSFDNTSNFDRVFDQVLQDIDQQYLICYRAPIHKKPGEYHKIKLTCKKDGVSLRYRKGYLD